MSNGKNTRMASDEKLIEGTNKHPSKGEILDGRTYSVKELVSILQERVNVSAEVVAARAEWRAKVRAERDKLKETDKLVSAYRQTILLRYASWNHILADFGLAPRKTRRELTAVEKLERVARAKSTRDARHTVGSRQKARIHGTTDVSVVVTTGATAPSPAPVPPAPVPTPTPPLPPPTNGLNGAVAAGGP
jgi:hypothetical protein